MIYTPIYEEIHSIVWRPSYTKDNILSITYCIHFVTWFHILCFHVSFCLKKGTEKFDHQQPSPTSNWETEAGKWLPTPSLISGSTNVPGHHQQLMRHPGCPQSPTCSWWVGGHINAANLTPFPLQKLGPPGTSFLPHPSASVRKCYYPQCSSILPTRCPHPLGTHRVQFYVPTHPVTMGEGPETEGSVQDPQQVTARAGRAARSMGSSANVPSTTLQQGSCSEYRH